MVGTRGLSPEQIPVGVALARGLDVGVPQPDWRRFDPNHWFAPLVSAVGPRDLSTVVVGAGAVTPVLTVNRTVVTTITGTSTVTSNIGLTKLLQTIIAGVGTVTPSIAFLRGMTTSVAGTATVTAAATLKSALRTVVAGIGQVVPNLSIVGAVPSGISGALKRMRRKTRQQGGAPGTPTRDKK